jgi:hypothetical protein
LCQHQRAHIAEEGIGWAPSELCLAPRLASPAEIGQGVGRGIGHFDLRLIGRNLVDDVAI